MVGLIAALLEEERRREAEGRADCIPCAPITGTCWIARGWCQIEPRILLRRENERTGGVARCHLRAGSYPLHPGTPVSTVNAELPSLSSPVAANHPHLSQVGWAWHD